MADRPKRMSHAPKRFVDDFYEIGAANVSKVEKRLKIDKNLHEVEIVDVNKERKQMKIHFVGLSEEFDEWRDYDGERDYSPLVRLEKVFLPNGGSMEDRRNIFHDQLYRVIKRKLWSGRRDDPEVRIEMNVDPDVFSTGLGQVTLSTSQRGKDVYSVTDNRLLDGVLGLKWDERIMNSSGDFAYVEKNTVRFWMTKKTPIQEYKYIGGKYVKCEIEDAYMLVFTFVRGDGNRRHYMERR